jgi:hypothetical protein
MALRLANEGDCRVFQFWLRGQCREGICCQGEIFLKGHAFTAKERDQAYEMGAQLAEKTPSVVIVCGREQYVIGVDLQGDIWRDILQSTIVIEEPDIVKKLRARLQGHPATVKL